MVAIVGHQQRHNTTHNDNKITPIGVSSDSFVCVKNRLDLISAKQRQHTEEKKIYQIYSLNSRFVLWDAKAMSLFVLSASLSSVFDLCWVSFAILIACLRIKEVPNPCLCLNSLIPLHCNCSASMLISDYVRLIACIMY